jgi:hypothetical protein
MYLLYVHSLVYNLVRPKTTTVPFNLNFKYVWSMHTILARAEEFTLVKTQFSV